MRRLLLVALVAPLVVGAACASFKDKRTPSGEFCSDMLVIPAGQEADSEYHRLQPISSDPKTRTEAERLGLVTTVADDPLAAARALAAEIAGRSPDAIRAAKQLYDRAWNGIGAAEALLLETELQVGLMGSANQIAAVTAAMSGEPGAFTDAS